MVETVQSEIRAAKQAAGPVGALARSLRRAAPAHGLGCLAAADFSEKPAEHGPSSPIHKERMERGSCWGGGLVLAPTSSHILHQQSDKRFLMENVKPESRAEVGEEGRVKEGQNH